MQSSMKNETRNMWLLILALTAVVLLRSPIAVGALPETDSSVYLYVASEIQQGSVPYVDTFDHKGPLLYLINWMGLLVGGWRGIALFEAATFAMTFYFIFRIARLRTSFPFAAVILSLCAVGIVKFYGGGNTPEEYAVPWIALADFLFLRMFLQPCACRRDAFLLGFGLAMTVLLKPNLMVVWLIGYPSALWCLRRQEGMLRFIVWTALGVGAGVAPFLLWFGMHHALPAWWDVYLTFNVRYTAGMAPDMLQRVKTFLYFFVQGGVEVLALCGWAMWRAREHRSAAAWFSLVTMICFLIAVSMSGRMWPHYAPGVVPLFAYPLAVWAAWFAKRYAGTKALRRSWYVGWAAVALIFPLLAGVAYRHHEMLYRTEEQQTRAIAAYVQGQTQPDDRISVTGNHDIFYVWSKRRSASYYSYQVPIFMLDSSAEQRYFNDLEQTFPRLIVLASPGDARMEAFLSEHAYEKLNEMPLKGGTVEIYRCP